jgi:hypothetical protein
MMRAPAAGPQTPQATQAAATPQMHAQPPQMQMPQVSMPPVKAPNMPTEVLVKAPRGQHPADRDLTDSR